MRALGYRNQTAPGTNRLRISLVAGRLSPGSKIGKVAESWRELKMKNPRAVAKRIAEFHNESMKRSVEQASTIEDKVIRLVENVVEDASAKTAEETIELHRKLLEIAHANVHAYFEWLHEIVKVDSPSDFTAVCMKHSQQQFETFRQQTRELGALGQKAALESMGPLGIVFGNALIGRPDLC